MTRLPFDYAVRNLGRSPLRLALAVGSCALATLLVVAGVGFVRGLERSLGATGLAQNVILLGAGSEESIERSEISPQVATLAAGSIDGVRSLPPGDDGVAFVSPEVHAALPVNGPDAATAGDGPILILRGVTPAAHLVHPQVRIVEGRAPEPGADETILGAHARTTLQAAGIDASVGSSIALGRSTLQVVGHFAAPGTAFDGEAWVPLAALKTITQRTTDSCVVLSLGPDADPSDVDAFAATRIDLELVAMPETDYYAALGRFLAPIRALVLATSLIVAFGAFLGALGTLDVAFASRIREIGTLRSIGYGRMSIVLSFLQESLLFAATGALVGSLAALAVVDGFAVRSSMGTFAVTVDAVALLVGFGVAFALGVAGALIPASRCLRRGIPESLRAAT
ncbi:MAG: ABC transporter permease [Phycisphaerae bacterium]|nr:ABC transporter permease [Phycisphaerae bacterium]